jgi:hypothetical protein
VTLWIHEKKKNMEGQALNEENRTNTICGLPHGFRAVRLAMECIAAHCGLNRKMEELDKEKKEAIKAKEEKH